MHIVLIDLLLAGSIGVALLGPIDSRQPESVNMSAQEIYLPSVLLDSDGGGSPPTLARCVHSIRSDYGSDNSIDNIVIQSHDLWSNPVLRTTDSDGDGRVDSERYWLYNSQGDETETGWSRPGREPHTIVRTTYDELRRLVKWEAFVNGGSAASESLQREYRLERGEIVTKEDRDGDGVIDSITTLFLGGANIVRVEVDNGPDGIVDQTEHRTWVSRTLVRVERDIDGDKDIDRRIVYAYDDHGRLSAKRTDGDSDGRFDAEEYYTYSATSKLVREDHFRGGQLENTIVYEYGQDERIALETISSLFSTDLIHHSYACN